MKKKKGKKKAFTIIELLIAIMIIGILAIIAVPLVGRYLENGKQNYYEALGNELEVMARNYFTDNRKELPRGQLNDNGGTIYYKVLTLEELEKANYVTNEVVDTNKNSCEQSYIAIENDKNGNYEYQVCLVCDGEVRYGDEEKCIFGGLKDDDNPTCDIAINGDYKLNTWTNKDVTITVTAYDKTGIGKISLIGGKSSFPKDNNIEESTQRKVSTGQFTINSNKNEKAEVNVYDVAGNSGYCMTQDVVKIDKDPPSSCQVEIVGSTELTRTIKVTGEDKLSGAKEFNLYLGTTKLESHEENNQLYTVKRNGMYEGKIVDEAGNVSVVPCSVQVTGLDNVAPTITAQVTKTVSTSTSGVYGVGSEVTVTCVENESEIDSFTTILDGVDGTLQENTTTRQSKKVVLSTNGQNKSITATCIDTAGNKATKTFNYNVQTYSQSTACGYNTCLTGSNTCSYGCGSCYDSCASTGTSSYCKTCTCWSSAACPSNYTYCGSYGPSCCNAGLQYMNPGYNDYSCTSCGHCGTGYSSYCIGGYYSCGCSSCYYGSNTCQGGYNTCWHY